jgi:hypothetical protein
MEPSMSRDWSSTTHPRAAALIAGIALLVMAVIAPLASFGVINNMLVPGDAGATASNLVSSESLFRLGAVGLVIVALLDVLVAWGLYVVLRSVNQDVSLLGAFLRLVYAALFALAANSLFSALLEAPLDPAQSLFFLQSFDYAWQIGLIIFGVHLGVVGYLAWRAQFIHWIFGLLLIISGLGYFVDGVGFLLSPGYSLGLSLYTFIGELVFTFWLLIRGARLPDNLASDVVT